MEILRQPKFAAKRPYSASGEVFGYRPASWHFSPAEAHCEPFPKRIGTYGDFIYELRNGQEERSDFVTVVLWAQDADFQKEIDFGGGGLQSGKKVPNYVRLNFLDSARRDVG